LARPAFNVNAGQGIGYGLVNVFHHNFINHAAMLDFKVQDAHY
jgi:ureidoglycolate hydrolase